MRHSPHPAEVVPRNVSRDARLVRSIGPLWQRVTDGTRTPTSRALPCDGRGIGGTRMGFDLCEPAMMGHRPPAISHTQRRDRARAEPPTQWPSMKPLGTWGDLDHPMTAPGTLPGPLSWWVLQPSAPSTILTTLSFFGHMCAKLFSLFLSPRPPYPPLSLPPPPPPPLPPLPPPPPPSPLLLPSSTPPPLPFSLSLFS